MKAIIVDDELNNRENLRQLLQIHCPQVTVAACCASAAEARNEILRLDPGLVFLDIEMPGGNGFSLLENLKITLLRIIFQRIRPQRIYKQQIGTVFRVESALIVSLYFHFIKSGLFELYRPGGIDITRIRRYNFPCRIVGRQLVGIEILNVEKQFIIHAVILRSYLRIGDKTVLILRQNGGIQP